MTFSNDINHHFNCASILETSIGISILEISISILVYIGPYQIRYPGVSKILAVYESDISTHLSAFT